MRPLPLARERWVFVSVRDRVSVGQKGKVGFVFDTAYQTFFHASVFPALDLYVFFTFHACTCAPNSPTLCCRVVTFSLFYSSIYRFTCTSLVLIEGCGFSWTAPSDERYRYLFCSRRSAVRVKMYFFWSESVFTLVSVSRCLILVTSASFPLDFRVWLFNLGQEIYQAVVLSPQEQFCRKLGSHFLFGISSELDGGGEGSKDTFLPAPLQKKKKKKIVQNQKDVDHFHRIKLRCAILFIYLFILCTFQDNKRRKTHQCEKHLSHTNTKGFVDTHSHCYQIAPRLVLFDQLVFHLRFVPQWSEITFFPRRGSHHCTVCQTHTHTLD